MTSEALPPQKKSRVWVVLLVLFGVVVLGGVGLVVAAFLWFDANKDRLATMGREAHAAADAFAASHDQSACLDEGLKKSDACDGIMCETGAKMFVERCVERAAPTPGFCEGVPPAGEIMKTVSWVEDQCKRRGAAVDMQKCSRLVQGVPSGCHRLRR